MPVGHGWPCRPTSGTFVYQRVTRRNSALDSGLIQLLRKANSVERLNGELLYEWASKDRYSQRANLVCLGERAHIVDICVTRCQGQRPKTPQQRTRKSAQTFNYLVGMETTMLDQICVPCTCNGRGMLQPVGARACAFPYLPYLGLHHGQEKLESL